MIAIRQSCLIAVGLFALAAGHPAHAQSAFPTAEAGATWADLADLADASDLVVRAKVKKQAIVPAERARGVAPGNVRLYVEAETLALIAGTVPVGESLRYLVDLPLDSRGKPPKLKRLEVLLFARPVPGRTGDVQLVARDAQMLWSEPLEARLRPILSAFAERDAAPELAGIRDALSVRGNLSGESETQFFLDTTDGEPLAMSVVRRPGMAPAWGVSYSEIVDQAVSVPQRETLAWYRLACFLPAVLPGPANLSRDPANRAQASEDYRFVMGSLGPCDRNRTPPQG
ncbi:hypothetical protein [Parerythrobacter jejuensis]|uniref:Uncharacterized protein n=1 Tax=Parerythrobacter jejuensis TaxID=795812 RepID=A0A845AJB5_9SPHN|nr:hypothetical protein [Parerythrobacter jejuensis]MXP30802.1 hypothetical protein [Parerythrobacter jejuensis]MXP33562.1 hypothetical protein [Parerythrobacter jejuensis]